MGDQHKLVFNYLHSHAGFFFNSSLNYVKISPYGVTIYVSRSDHKMKLKGDVGSVLRPNGG